jgi:hypothetical protein
VNLRRRATEILAIAAVCAVVLWLTGAWPTVISFVSEITGHGG